MNWLDDTFKILVGETFPEMLARSDQLKSLYQQATVKERPEGWVLVQTNTAGEEEVLAGPSTEQRIHAIQRLPVPSQPGGVLYDKGMELQGSPWWFMPDWSPKLDVGGDANFYAIIEETAKRMEEQGLLEAPLEFYLLWSTGEAWPGMPADFATGAQKRLVQFLKGLSNPERREKLEQILQISLSLPQSPAPPLQRLPASVLVYLPAATLQTAFPDFVRTARDNSAKVPYPVAKAQFEPLTGFKALRGFLADYPDVLDNQAINRVLEKMSRALQATLTADPNEVRRAYEELKQNFPARPVPDWLETAWYNLQWNTEDPAVFMANFRHHSQEATRKPLIPERAYARYVQDRFQDVLAQSDPADVDTTLATLLNEFAQDEGSGYLDTPELSEELHQQAEDLISRWLLEQTRHAVHGGLPPSGGGFIPVGPLAEHIAYWRHLLRDAGFTPSRELRSEWDLQTQQHKAEYLASLDDLPNTKFQYLSATGRMAPPGMEGTEARWAPFRQSPTTVVNLDQRGAPVGDEALWVQRELSSRLQREGRSLYDLLHLPDAQLRGWLGSLVMDLEGRGPDRYGIVPILNKLLDLHNRGINLHADL